MKEADSSAREKKQAELGWIRMSGSKRSLHVGKSLWPGRINMGNDMHHYFNLEKNSYNLIDFFFHTRLNISIFINKIYKNSS